MLKKVVLIAVLVVIIGGIIVLAVTNLNDSNENARIKVVASNFASYDFLRAITKDVEGVNINFLLGPGKDTHSYDPTASDIIKMQESDMLVYIGGEVEAWTENVVPTLNTEKTVLVKMSDSVDLQKPIHIEGAQHDHHHEEESHNHEHDHEDKEESHDHEHDHEHKEESHDHEHDHEDKEESHEHNHAFDEHIWTSPENAIKMIKELETKMIYIDSENADKYKENAKAYITEIEKFDNEMKAVIESSSKDKLVFGDKMPMQYFIEYYDLDVAAAFTGCSTETEPSTKTITGLTDLVKNENIPVILYTELSDGKVANVIADEIGNNVKTMQIQTLHNVSKDNFDNGATYVSLMRSNIEVIKEALK